MPEPAVEQVTTSPVRARRLGDIGQPEAANRFAGEAYAAIRAMYPEPPSRSMASWTTIPGLRQPGGQLEGATR